MPQCCSLSPEDIFMESCNYEIIALKIPSVHIKNERHALHQQEFGFVSYVY